MTTPTNRGALVRLVLEMRDNADRLGRNLAAEPAEVRARELLRQAADVLEDVSRLAEEAAAASPPLRTAGGGSFDRPPAWLGPQTGAQDPPLVDGFYWIEGSPESPLVALRTSSPGGRVQWDLCGSDDYFLGDDKIVVLAGPLSPPANKDA